MNTEAKIIEALQNYALSLGCTEYLHRPKEQRDATSQLLELMREARIKENLYWIGYYLDGKNAVVHHNRVATLTAESKE